MIENIGRVAVLAAIGAALITSLVYVCDRRGAIDDRRNSMAHAGFIGGMTLTLFVLMGVDWQFASGGWRFGEQIVRLLLCIGVGMLAHELLLKILYRS